MVSKKQGLLFGTVILLLSNIFVKGLGFFYRVVLVRILGTEGVGLIEMVTPLFVFLLVSAGMGIQLAVSQKTATESGRNNDREIAGIFRTALSMLFISGLIVTMAAFFLSPLLIEHFAPDKRIFACFQAIIPAVFIISIASAYRGYFQGMRQISTLGASQSIEQTVRVVVGISLALQFSGLGLEKAVTATSIASVLGETAGFIYLLLRMRNQKQQMPPATNFSFPTAGRLLSFGMPVTFSRLVISMIMMAQAFLIPFALQRAGYDVHSATEIYGRFAGVAMALLNLPGIFTTALAVSVMPAVAETGITGGKLLSHRISNSLQATMIFTLPGMMILYLFAGELCAWIFHNPEAAGILRILSLGGIFIYLQVTVISILQGLGEVRALLINSILSGICLLTGIYTLASLPALGINGAAIAINIAYITGFALNFLHLLRICRPRIKWSNIFFKPPLALFFCIIVYKLGSPYLAAYSPGQEKMAVIAIILLLLIIYFIILACTGGLSIGIWRRIFKK